MHERTLDKRLLDTVLPGRTRLKALELSSSVLRESRVRTAIGHRGQCHESNRLFVALGVRSFKIKLSPEEVPLSVVKINIVFLVSPS